MKYRVVETGDIFDNIDDVLEACIEDDYHENDDYFEEWINDCYTGVEIGGYEYSAYQILDNAGDLDGFLEDFCESQNEADSENADWELRHAHVGTEVYIQRYTVEVIEDDEDEENEEEDTVDVNTPVSVTVPAEEENQVDETDIMALFQKIGR